MSRFTLSTSALAILAVSATAAAARAFQGSWCVAQAHEQLGRSYPGELSYPRSA